MEIVVLFAVVVFLAFLTETLTEYFVGPFFDKIPALTPHRWLIMYIAAAVGVLGAFVYQLDLIHFLSEWLAVMFKDSNIQIGIIPINTLGLVLTGLCMGRGANFIHQIQSTYFPLPKP